MEPASVLRRAGQLFFLVCFVSRMCCVFADRGQEIRKYSRDSNAAIAAGSAMIRRELSTADADQVETCQCPGLRTCGLVDVSTTTDMTPQGVHLRVANNCDACVATSIFLDCGAVLQASLPLCQISNSSQPLLPHQAWDFTFPNAPGLGSVPVLQAYWKCA